MHSLPLDMNAILKAIRSEVHIELIERGIPFTSREFLDAICERLVKIKIFVPPPVYSDNGTSMTFPRSEYN